MTDSIKIAFNRVNKNSNIYERLIDKWTGSYGYFHVEIIVYDNDNLSFSSREGKGVNYIKRYDFSNVEEWEVITIDYIDKEQLLKFCTSQVGKKYDWKGLFFNFLTPFRYQEKNKWFCSEIVAEALKYGGYIKLAGYETDGISPNELYKIITSNKGK